jgi:ABC-type Fe3+ transport system substrate-binding protein
VITGTTTALEALQPAAAIVPIQPYLVGPSTPDPSPWLGGKLTFADEASQVNLVFGAYAKEGFVYNPDLVAPSEFRSYRDLLDPKWRGKIVVRNPAVAGGGMGTMTFFYATESLGPEYIRQFLANGVTIAGDDRQILDWVGRGQYPIALGVSNPLTNQYIERGLPIRLLDGAALQESTYLTAGPSTFVVVKNPPHPNAVKVYLDYMLSQEGQYEWSKQAGFPSLRRDVPTDHLPRALVPKEGVSYLPTYNERYVRLREEVVAFLRPLLAR